MMTRRRLGVLALLIAGCFHPPAGANLASPSPVSDPVPQRALLARVEIADPSVSDRGRIEEALTGSIRDYLQEGRYFTDVLPLPVQPRVQDLVLYFRFDRYRLERTPHAAYFPAALLTATLYIWVGGPIFNDTTDIAGTLTVEAGDGVVIARTSAATSERHSVSFWSPEYFLPGSIRGRTIVVQQLVEDARVRLRQGG